MAFFCKYCGSTAPHDRRPCHLRYQWQHNSEFVARNRRKASKLMHRLNSDPEFVARKREWTRRRNLNPQYNKLALLTPAERADFDAIRAKRFRRAEALAMIGRHDLIPAADVR